MMVSMSYKQSNKLLIDPNSLWYSCFSYYMALIAIVSAFFQPYLLAFKGTVIVLDECTLWTVVYVIISLSNLLDFVLRFFLRYKDGQTGERMKSLQQTGFFYVTRKTFLLDLVAAFPLHWLIVEVAGAAQVEWADLQYLEIICLVQLVQVHRVMHLVERADDAMIVSQTTIVIIRNYVAIMLDTHLAACGFWFVAKMELFGPNSWVGRNSDRFDGANNASNYCYTLYYVITIFVGLSDSDLFPATLPECLFAAYYMLLNVYVSAYTLGTVTMLVVGGDERSKELRRRVSNLLEFSRIHELPQALCDAMLNHLNVHFQVEHTSNESVLSIYPTTLKRKVLRHMYAHTVRDCYLFRRCKAQFLDAFMAAARVELFMPQEQVIAEGDNVNELHIVVGGEFVCGPGDLSSLAYGLALSGHGSVARLSQQGSVTGSSKLGSMHASYARFDSSAMMHVESTNSLAREGSLSLNQPDCMLRGRSQPFGEVSFFSETSSDDSVYSVSVAQVLVLGKASWEALTQQFPQQARLVLENLQLNLEETLSKEVQMAAEKNSLTEEQVSTALKLIAASSTGESLDPKLLLVARNCLAARQLKRLSRLDDLQSVVAKYVRKVDQMRVFEFLNVAARGDREGVRQMLSQGMSVDTEDYDGRTALMLAAGAGHGALVQFLLESGVDHSRKDKFGNTAMIEAIRNNHDHVVDMLLAVGSHLGTEAYNVAVHMCNAVYAGNLKMLRRFLRAGATPNAADYDQRCALHIAGAEGNLEAVKILVEEAGADVMFADRWGNRALDEALRVNATDVVEYLEGHMSKAAVGLSKAKRRQGVMKDVLNSCSSNNSARLANILATSAPPCMGLALLTAAAHGNMECLSKLLESDNQRSLLSLYGSAALVEAAVCGRVDVVERLWGLHVGSIDPREACLVETLMEALRCGELLVLHCLLLLGVNPNISLVDGSTPVHYAAVSNRLHELRTLVEVGGASVTETDSLGRTPLDAVMQEQGVFNAYKNSDVISYLRWLTMPGHHTHMVHSVFGALPDPRCVSAGSMNLSAAQLNASDQEKGLSAAHGRRGQEESNSTPLSTQKIVNSRMQQDQALKSTSSKLGGPREGDPLLNTSSSLGSQGGELNTSVPEPASDLKAPRPAGQAGGFSSRVPSREPHSVIFEDENTSFCSNFGRPEASESALTVEDIHASLHSSVSMTRLLSPGTRRSREPQSTVLRSSMSTRDLKSSGREADVGSGAVVSWGRSTSFNGWQGQSSATQEAGLESRQSSTTSRTGRRSRLSQKGTAHPVTAPENNGGPQAGELVSQPMQGLIP